jgi:hypothetical protein
MRTIIFILGLFFLYALTEHWGIIFLHEQSDIKYLAYIFLFAVAQDIVKK